MNPLNFFAVMVLSFALSTFVVTAPIVHEPEMAGYEVFLTTPGNYSFTNGCGLGEVLSASLEGQDQLSIEYFYRCNGQKYFGILSGQLDVVTGIFTGAFQMGFGGEKGTTDFYFSPAGEAEGTWNGQKSKVAIRLKE